MELEKTKTKIVGDINNLMREEYGEELNFTPIKTQVQFHRNYLKHDKAYAIFSSFYEFVNVEIITLGKDLRNEKVIMRNEIPDLLLISNTGGIAVDVKAKSSNLFFGWVNKRAVKGYRNFSNRAKIPVYAVFINIRTKEIGYTNIMNNWLYERSAWDKNVVYIFDWKEGLPPIN